MDISKEDYLRAIYIIRENSGQELIKSVDIAKELKITKPSVSAMIKKLIVEGYIKKKPYSKIKLTKKGQNKAIRITHKHRVIEVFLKEVLGYKLDYVHQEAHRLEHAFSDESIKRLDNYLKNPKVSPHGRLIPHES